MRNSQEPSLDDQPRPGFASVALGRKYDEWYRATESRQISAIAALTGVLYMVAAGLDALVAPAAVASLMITIHLLLVPPVLFLASALLYFPKTYRAGVAILFVSPIWAALGNIVIVPQLENPELYQTEVYLILFWIFTVSGLRLRPAMASALAVVVLVTASTVLYFPIGPQAFTMHAFWMFAACAFGTTASFFRERSSKAIFSANVLLEERATTDKLTGLYNRSKIDDVLQNEIHRSERTGQHFGLVVMDIDHFKQVNDEHGHLVGDDVLVAVGELLDSCTRKVDVVARWGGEEFMVLFLGTTGEAVGDLAEKLRLAIKGESFEAAGAVTASFGGTSYVDGDTSDSIIHRADRALYEAKRLGRDRVVVA